MADLIEQGGSPKAFPCFCVLFREILKNLLQKCRFCDIIILCAYVRKLFALLDTDYPGKEE